MKILAMTFVAAGLLTGDIGRLSAETIDLSTIKCSDFVTTSKEEIGYAAAWLDAAFCGITRIYFAHPKIEKAGAAAGALSGAAADLSAVPCAAVSQGAAAAVHLRAALPRHDCGLPGARRPAGGGGAAAGP